MSYPRVHPHSGIDIGPAGAGGTARWIAPWATVLYCVILTHADIYAGMKSIIPFNIMMIMMLMVGSWVLLSVSSGLAVVHANGVITSISENRLPLFAFLMWSLGHLLFLGEVALDPLDIDYIELFPIYQFGLLMFGIAIGITPGFSTARLVAGKAALLVLGGSIIYDSIVPGTFSTLAHRGAGFAQNANVAAFNLAAILAMSIRYRRFYAIDGAALLFTAIAIFLTFSRSGLGQLAVIVLVYIASLLAASRREGGSSRLMAGAAAVVVMLGSTAFFADEILELTTVSKLTDASQSREARERIDQLLLRGDRGLIDDPYRGPIHVYYTRLIYERPFAGYGPGFSLSKARYDAPFGVGPHSMYVRVWVDNGLWGLITYSAFVISALAVMLSRHFLPGAILMTSIIAYGFFDHNLIDNKTCLLLTGMALGLSTVRPGRSAGV